MAGHSRGQVSAAEHFHATISTGRTVVESICEAPLEGALETAETARPTAVLRPGSSAERSIQRPRGSAEQEVANEALGHFFHLKS